MNKFPSRLSAARRNAEALLQKTQKQETDFKAEQERERDALALKSARLRELRLAKEAAEQREAGPPPAASPKPRKPRRSKQT